MNRIESQDQNIIQKAGNYIKGEGKRVIAAGLVGITLMGSVGCDNKIEASNEPTAPEITATIGETNTPGMTDTPGVTNTPEVTATINETETPGVTSEPTEKPTPTPSPTVEVTPTPEPLLAPTGIEEYNQKLLVKYEVELTANECKPEYKLICSKLLNVLDSDKSFIRLDDSKIEESKVKYYIDRQQILNLGKGDRGDLQIMDFKDGTPAYLFVNCDPRIIEDSKTAIKKNEVAAPDFLKTITDNGMCVLFQYKFDNTNIAMGTYDAAGVVVVNDGEKDLADRELNPNFVNSLRLVLLVEPFGVRTQQLGGEYAVSYCGYLKSMLASYSCLFLYQKTGDSYWNEMGEVQTKGNAKQYADEYGLAMDDPHLLELLKNIMDNNWSKPYGADNWQEVMAN